MLDAAAAPTGPSPDLFSGMGHNMMFEPGWADGAEQIHAWLETRGLATQAV